MEEDKTYLRLRAKPLGMANSVILTHALYSDDLKGKFIPKSRVFLL